MFTYPKSIRFMQSFIARIHKEHNICVLDYFNRHKERELFVNQLSGRLDKDLFDFVLSSIKNINQMDLSFDLPKAEPYKSPSQKIRVLSEDWVARQIYCPACGSYMSRSSNNSPVFDFICHKCREEFELKSKKEFLGKKILDGAYETMIERLKSANNPNFFFLNYHPKNFQVLNFLVIPKHFFIPDVIEIRKPLAPSAGRAGWVGCNILIDKVPNAGRIFLVRNQVVESKSKVLQVWNKALFLRGETLKQSKGWILDVMKCIDSLNKKEFTLDEMYAFECKLREKYPNNKHIKDKIRQQLQFLRDKGYVDFVSKGKYKLSA